MAMIFKIEYISAFHADISNVANNLKDYPQKAKRIFEKLDRALRNLAEMPEIYPIYEYVPVFRKIIIEDYLLFYYINEMDGIIEIHRLIYGRMDIKNQLGV